MISSWLLFFKSSMTATVKALLLCDHNHKKSFSIWTVIEIVIATRYFKPSIIKYTVQKFYWNKYQRIGLGVWNSGIETNWQEFHTAFTKAV